MIGKAVHGYLLSDDGLTTIDDPNILPSAPVTYANGVNPEGDVAGYYLDPPPGTDISTLIQGQMGMDFDMSGDPPPSTRLRGFLRSRSYPSDGYIQTMPIRINPMDKVVGCFHHFGNDFQNTMHGFVYHDGQYEFFPVNGTMHNGLTTHGRIIVGVGYPDLTHYHSYAVVDGVYGTFDPPGAVISAAWDINPAVRSSVTIPTPLGQPMAYLVGKDGFLTMDFPGATMT
jgi:hypothetical protein